MGRVLDIRVIAQTYREEDVAAAWPALCALAWPQWAERQGVERIGLTPGPVTGPGPVEKALGERRHGVMELAEALPDLVRFGDLDADTEKALERPAAGVDEVRRKLDKALADWDVQTARRLTDELEDALSAAEAAVGGKK